jgi:hypothetical protein
MSTPADSDCAPEGRRAGGTDPREGREATGGSPLVFDDPLDRPSPDDADRGWGGSIVEAEDDDFARFLNEKPPHHL